MKRFTAIFFAAVVALFGVSAVSAQSSDYHKFEWFGGYSYHSTDTGLDDLDPNLDSRVGSHGFETSGTGNLSRYVGIKGDFSFHNKSWTFTDSGNTANIKLRTSQFLGGVQFKDNNKDAGTFRPFAHVLAGVASQRISATVTGPGAGSDSFTENNFAMAFGGGLDVKATDKIDIRVFQFDYNPVFEKDQTFFGTTLQGRTQNNFRIGVGIVIH